MSTSPGHEPTPAVRAPRTAPAPALPERFENPGLPPHRPRRADVDPKAAKRAERQVALMFTLSMLASLAFVAAYFLLPMDLRGFVLGIGEMSLYHLVLGLTMAVSLLGIGFGAVHWAKTLMPDTEMVESRYDIRSSEEEQKKAAGILSAGLQESQLARRPALLVTMAGALGLFALPIVVPVAAGLAPIRSLGDPYRELTRTAWATGKRLMIDPSGTPIRPGDVTQGSVFHVMPEGYVGEEALHGEHAVPGDELLNVRSTSAVILVRMNPSIIQSEKERAWGFDGIVAYSKVCTHVGCPVALYEQTTHHLLCPCHQSTFDMTRDCEVIFGPAKRPLPQLPITVDDEGYLVAVDDFREPVGPSYWERG